MNYQLELLVDDDFDASNLRGITFINGNTAIVDEVIFKDNVSNLIRQIKFIIDNEPEYKNRFISNILSYYNKYGKLSEKQVEKCFELI